MKERKKEKEIERETKYVHTHVYLQTEAYYAISVPLHKKSTEEEGEQTNKGPSAVQSVNTRYSSMLKQKTNIRYVIVITLEQGNEMYGLVGQIPPPRDLMQDP